MKKYKEDELIQFMEMISKEISAEKNCLGFELLKIISGSNLYKILVKWKNNESMKQHFIGRNYITMSGALKVLGDDYKIIHSEIIDSDE